jgi:hypothetical protein
MQSNPAYRSRLLDDAMAVLLTNEAVEVQQAVTLLLKIVNNIATYPLEDKYRKVNRLSSAFSKKIGALRGGDACMVALGFALQQDDWILYPTAEAWEHLNACKAILERFLRRLESVDLASIEAAAKTTPSTTESASKPEPVATGTATTTDATAAAADPNALLLQQMLINMALSSAGTNSSSPTAAETSDFSSVDPSRLKEDANQEKSEDAS